MSSRTPKVGSIRQADGIDHDLVVFRAMNHVLEIGGDLPTGDAVVAVAEEQHDTTAVLVQERGDTAIDGRPDR